MGVLSGNRNFEGRINPHTRANYLASPLLCIAYALAGTVNIDFDTDPLGKRTLIIRTVCNIVISRYRWFWTAYLSEGHMAVTIRYTRSEKETRSTGYVQGCVF